MRHAIEVNEFVAKLKDFGEDGFLETYLRTSKVEIQSHVEYLDDVSQGFYEGVGISVIIHVIRLSIF